MAVDGSELAGGVTFQTLGMSFASESMPVLEDRSRARMEDGEITQVSRRSIPVTIVDLENVSMVMPYVVAEGQLKKGCVLFIASPRV